MTFVVLLSGLDPDDPGALTPIGARKTRRGAEALAEKRAGHRIYGWYACGPAHDPGAATEATVTHRRHAPTRVRIERGLFE